ncbi:hypothetical protein [Kineococcus aurantiacus]|uniref:PRC-barrel domain containing protein n=1 Tax=Kineococcus aurantiacus TaxID=37633 RepID=A0A7Y9ARY0_9ACTN|nr:hypothetical protein [Kineococcus aurantiacus]NYD20511.1 hypothetical protein [Kineococcus aurantiacus]
MPISEDQAFLVARSVAVDRDGTQVGPVTGIYYDDHTGRPEWVTVALALDPSEADGALPPAGERFVPLASAAYSRGRLHLDVTTGQVRTAPQVADGNDHLDGAAEVDLYRHYGLSPAGDTDVDPATGTTPRTHAEPGDHSLLPPVER